MHRHQSNRLPVRILAQAGAPAAVGEELSLSAELDITAAGDSAKPATFALTAYTGGAIRVSAYLDPTVIDVAGIQAGATIPLLADHRNHLDAMLGAGKPTIDVARSIVTLAGPLARGSSLTEHLIELGKRGITPQASVGGLALRTEFVASGSTVKVNGREFNGPISVVREFQLREISVVPIGADAETATSINATGTPSPEVARERARYAECMEILGAAPRDPELADQVRELDRQAREGNITAGALATELLKLSRSSADLRDHRATYPNTVPWGLTGRRVRGTAPTGDAIAASLMMLNGDHALAEKSYGAEACELAATMRVRTFMDAVEACIAASGRNVPHDTNEIIANAVDRLPALSVTASFSTISLPTILSDVLNKKIAAELAEQEATWRSFTKIVSSTNFHPTKVGRLIDIKRWTPVGPGGELQHGVLNESFYEVTPHTEGHILGVTRHDIINDNMGFLGAIPSTMAIGGARAMSDAVYTALLANAGSFFAAGNNNYIEGAGTALGVDSLGIAIKTMRNQTDEAGRPVSIVPRTLVVGPSLESTARAVLTSMEILGTSGPSGNPVRDIVKLEVEPRLENATFTGYSEVHWYLFAAPYVGAMNLVVLNGKETPTVESAAADFHTLGMQFRGYHDFGAGLGEPRGAVRSKGEA